MIIGRQPDIGLDPASAPSSVSAPASSLLTLVNLRRSRAVILDELEELAGFLMQVTQAFQLCDVLHSDVT